jgi:hypothetical protein
MVEKYSGPAPHPDESEKGGEFAPVDVQALWVLKCEPLLMLQEIPLEVRVQTSAFPSPSTSAYPIVENRSSNPNPSSR